MKTIYILDSTDLVFTSWEDCVKFMEKVNEDHEGYYSEIFIDKFYKYLVLEE